MARARCGIGCEYTVYSGYLPWSFISLLPCSILSSRNPSPARFHHQPSLPQPSLPPLTLRACVASLLPLSLPLLSPSFPLFPLPPSPCSLPPPLPPSPCSLSHHHLAPSPSLPSLLPSLCPSHLLFSLAPSLSHIIASSLPPAPCSLRPSHLLFSRAPSLPLAACFPPAVQLNIHCVSLSHHHLSPSPSHPSLLPFLCPSHLLFSIAPSLSHIIASSLPPAPCSLRPSHILFSRAPSLPLAACLPPAV